MCLSSISKRFDMRVTLCTAWTLFFHFFTPTTLVSLFYFLWDIELSNNNSIGFDLLLFIFGSLYDVSTSAHSLDYSCECTPELIWPSSEKQIQQDSATASLWHLISPFPILSSTIISIKRLRRNCPDGAESVPSFNALYPYKLFYLVYFLWNFNLLDAFFSLSTLYVWFCELGFLTIHMLSTFGSEAIGGSVCILKLDQPINQHNPSLCTQIVQLVSLDRTTIWTSDCNPQGTQAVIGNFPSAYTFIPYLVFNYLI